MAVDVNTTYYTTPQAPTGYELSPVKSFWGLVSSTPTINYIANPSFEVALTATSTLLTTTNATLSRVTDFATRGKYGMKITPSSAALSAVIMKDSAIGTPAAQYSFYFDKAGRYAWSFDFKGSPGKTYRMVMVEVDGSPIERNSITWVATGNLEHKTISATFSFNSAGAIHWLEIEQTTASSAVYYTDSWQLEKDYPTTYTDGDQGGTWLSSPNAGYSKRGLNKTGGRVYNFKTDLEFPIEGYIGAGLPDVENHALLRGLLNGATYQRTTTGPVIITLIGSVGGVNLVPIQEIRQRMEAICCPVASEQQGPPLLLQFQLLDPSTGAPAGKLLEIPVFYVDGLKGITDNASLEKIPLRFICYNPPAIRELETEIYKSVCYKNTITWKAALNSATTFARNNQYGWASDQIEGRCFALANGQIYGTTATKVKSLQVNVDSGGTDPVLYDLGLIATLSDPGTPSNVTVLAMVATADNKLYCAGSTNSGNFLRCAYYNLNSGDTTWSVMLFGLNNTSRALCVERSTGYVYYGGDFTAAGNAVAGDYETQRVVLWVGTSWNRLGTAGAGNNGVNNTVRALACGLDDTVYVGGDFTQAAAVVTTGIARWNRAKPAFTGTWTAMPVGGTGVAGGVVNAIAVSPTTGQVFIGGTFTSVSGITANKIACWNGSAWLPVGGGLNGTVTALWFDAQGILYAAGLFTGTQDTGSYSFPWLIAKYNANNNASYWLPIDMDIVVSDATINAIAVNNAGDIFVGTSSLGTAGSGTDPYINYSCFTTVVNAGTADIGPKITITGPGDVWEITNQTTGRSLYFKNLTLQTGEVLTFDLSSPDAINATSSLRQGASMLGYILPGSDIATWALLPGENVITALIAGTTSAATAIDLYYYNTHWSFDAGVA